MAASLAQGALRAPFGWLLISRAVGGQIVGIDLSRARGGVARCSGPAWRAAGMEFEHYFADPRHRVRLPVVVSATPFQERVWKAIRRIAPGRILTYGALAAAVGSGARAVGGACGANPVPLIVPCHRVVGRSGMGGYSAGSEGDGAGFKEWLLRHEGLR